MQEPDKGDRRDGDQRVIGTEGDAPVTILPGKHRVDQRADRQHSSQNSESHHDLDDPWNAVQLRWMHGLEPKCDADHEQHVQKADAEEDRARYAGTQFLGPRAP